MTKDYEEHLNSDMRQIVVAFAGGPQNVYQFGKLLARIGVSHVLVRDSTQRYYQDGVAGLGDKHSVFDYFAHLRQHARVTMIGVSSGSYAALFYGQMTPADDVIVISPLSGREVDDFDPKWHSQIIDPAQPSMPDLRQFFRNGPTPRVRAYISDGEACELDRQMAERIGITEINLVPGYAHKDLARGMRDTGVLTNLLLP